MRVGDLAGVAFLGGNHGIGRNSGGSDHGNAQESRGAGDRLFEGERRRGDVQLAPVAGKLFCNRPLFITVVQRR